MGQLSAPLGLIGVGAAVVAAVRPAESRSRAVGLGIAVFVAALLATGWAIAPYFPSPPAI